MPFLSACVTLPSSSPIINPTLLRKPVGIILPPLSYLSLARPYLRPQAHYDPSEPLLLVSKAADRPSSNHFTVCAANGPPKAAATLHPVPDALLALGLKPRATFDKSTLVTHPKHTGCPCLLGSCPDPTHPAGKLINTTYPT
ncbi:hypothetical protein PtB15_3B33 [Puccinia triticina]|nr:hypothetical protein PtB15_3B33 [Puccinia triticina]